jgi:hypothetical protein
MPDALSSSALPSPPASASIARLAEEAAQAIDAARTADELYAWLGSFCEAIGFEYDGRLLLPQPVARTLPAPRL